MLRYTITEEGTLGERWEEPAPAAQKAALPVVGGALPLPEEDEDDWDGDAPDVSADFARLAHPEQEERTEQVPLTADFEALPDGTWALLRWPRLARPAVVPPSVEGKPVTAVAATAFAAAHLAESLFAQMYTSPISFSIFSMRMGRQLLTETTDEGGPTAVLLPESIRRIGPYAFWRCDNLTEICLPRGITELPAGVFGECARLARVTLPEGLTALGYMPRPTDQIMPDVGVFAGCHSLRELTLPVSLTKIGAETFNSAGLRCLTALDTLPARWSRPVEVAATAFNHTASLLWLQKAAPGGSVFYRLGLPVARDKILAGDLRFGAILRVPADFFVQEPGAFDHLAQAAFRLDFSGRMALARLQYDAGLSAENRRWYLDLLVQYFDRAEQFMPPEKDPAEALFSLLEQSPQLTAEDMSALLRAGGQMGLSAELLARMMEVRTCRFSTRTGFEDLLLDDDLD